MTHLVYGSNDYPGLTLAYLMSSSLLIFNALHLYQHGMIKNNDFMTPKEFCNAYIVIALSV